MNKEEVKNILLNYNNFKEKAYEIAKKQENIRRFFIGQYSIPKDEINEYQYNEELDTRNGFYDYDKQYIMDSICIESSENWEEIDIENIENNKINFCWNTNGNDYGVRFPIEFFWKEDWEKDYIEQERQKLINHKEKIKKQRQVEEERNKLFEEEKQKREKNLYEELKEKYELSDEDKERLLYLKLKEKYDYKQEESI